MDQQPVRYFGISVVDSASVSLDRPPQVVRDREGRFQARGRAALPVDIVIAGPGFARRVLLSREVTPCATTDVGEVVVQRGIVLEGRTLDVIKEPIADATIVVSDGFAFEASDPLLELANNRFHATSKSDGSFRVVGVPRERVQLVATWGALGSGELGIADPSKSIDVVILPLGSISGTAANAAGEFVHLGSVANPSMSMVEHVDANGEFTFTNVPEGDYVIGIIGRRIAAPVQIVVAQNTSIAL